MCSNSCSNPSSRYLSVRTPDCCDAENALFAQEAGKQPPPIPGTILYKWCYNTSSEWFYLTYNGQDRVRQKHAKAWYNEQKVKYSDDQLMEKMIKSNKKPKAGAIYADPNWYVEVDVVDDALAGVLEVRDKLLAIARRPYTISFYGREGTDDETSGRMEIGHSRREDRLFSGLKDYGGLDAQGVDAALKDIPTMPEQIADLLKAIKYDTIDLLDVHAHPKDPDGYQEVLW